MAEGSNCQLISITSEELEKLFALGKCEIINSNPEQSLLPGENFEISTDLLTHASEAPSQSASLDLTDPVICSSSANILSTVQLHDTTTSSHNVVESKGKCVWCSRTYIDLPGHKRRIHAWSGARSNERSSLPTQSLNLTEVPPPDIAQGQESVSTEKTISISSEDPQQNESARGSSSRQAKSSGVTRRPARKCPECHKHFVELPSHMKNKHSWSVNKAAKVNYLTNQRIRYSAINKKRVKKRVECTKLGCYAMVLSLRDHLTRVHGLTNKKKVVNTTSAEILNRSVLKNLQQSEEPPTVEPADPTLDGSEDVDGSEGGTCDGEAFISNFMQSSHIPDYVETSPDYVLPSVLDEMINLFEEWTTGSQGGGNQEITSIHNSAMMRRICNLINATKIDDLLDDTKLWRAFLHKKNNGEWSGNTARSYMNAVKKFMGFINKDARFGRFTTEEQRVWAREIMVDLPNWSKSYRNQIGIETAKRKIRHAENLFDAAKVNKYKASEEHRTGFLLLSQCDDPEFVLTCKAFTCMRNYLMFNINIRNGNRAGVLMELTIDEFQRRVKINNRDDGTTLHMISVESHKTFGSHGLAKLNLSTQLNTLMELYANNVRPKITKDCCNKFFTTQFGKALYSTSAVTQSIKSHAAQAGVGHVTSNDCRRAATTLTREIDPSMSEAVAKHLNHSLDVANRVYDVYNKDAISFKASVFLDKVFSGEKKNPMQLEIEASENNQGDATLQTGVKSGEDEQSPTLMEGESQENNQGDATLQTGVKSGEDEQSPTLMEGESQDKNRVDAEDSDDEIIPSSIPERKKRSRIEQLESFVSIKSVSSHRTYTNEDREALKDLFRPLMEEGKFITGDQVDARIKTNLPEIFKKHGSKSVRNKYREFKHRYLKLKKM